MDAKSIFSVDVARLQDRFESKGNEFENFVKDLLYSYKSSIQLDVLNDQLKIEHDSNTYQSDGGIDIKCTANKTYKKGFKGFIEKGVNIYQIKSTTTSLNLDEKNGEARKKLVEILNQNKDSHYYHITLCSPAVAKREGNQRELKGMLEEWGVEKAENCKIIYPDKLAKLAEQSIPLCLKYNLYSTPLKGATIYDVWGKRYQYLGQKYYLDEQKKGVKEEIKKCINQEGSFAINVYGSLGIGRKRLVYESLAFKNFNVLFFEDWKSFKNSELYIYLNNGGIKKDQLKSLICVIGDCDGMPSDKNYFSDMKAAVLVSEKPLSTTTEGGIQIEVGQLDHKCIENIIKHDIKGNNIAPIGGELVNGNPKLAWLVNKIIQKK